jgi:PRTRC genetic system protein B
METPEVSVQDNRYVLGAAVMLYSQASNYQDGAGAIATVHHVHDIDGKPVIGAGRPMNEADYLAMVKVLAPQQRPQMEWQDHSILAKGMGKMIWWTPRMNRAMFFKKSDMFGATTFTGQGICPVPGMIWMSDGRDLFVYAYRGSAMPGKGTTLCQAPLFNVWARGEVCVGNASRPDDSARGCPQAWERFLFDSHFTHPNFAEVDRLTKGVKPAEFWKKMVAKPTKSFPESVLVDLELKVEDLMEPDFRTRVGKMHAAGEF